MFQQRSGFSRKPSPQTRWFLALSFLNLQIRSLIFPYQASWCTKFPLEAVCLSFHKAHLRGYPNYYWSRCKSVVASWFWRELKETSGIQATLRIPFWTMKKQMFWARWTVQRTVFALQSVLHSRLETFHFGLHSIHSTLLRMWYIRSDWWKLTNDSDVVNTTSHRVYQTGKGERVSEDATNDLGRLRIRLRTLKMMWK